MSLCGGLPDLYHASRDCEQRKGVLGRRAKSEGIGVDAETTNSLKKNGRGGGR